VILFHVESLVRVEQMKIYGIVKGSPYFEAALTPVDERGT
jgi:hypothetical protein